MKVLYQQRCARCKKNMVKIISRRQFPICYDCQKEELKGEIKNPKLRKLFDIPEDFYRESPFLRSVKSYYLKFGKISEKQEEWFKKEVNDLKEKLNKK